ncbi:telomerase reverse transcriptase [Babesia ovis]|uniref:Telomerase reverse transcriptase n=1 Tax=Babesia ovis TaxID=5869 RepID=A0A9W5WWN2_BABOV|nr:telomerase reverse transcriptase [Babesia ovis]
MLAHDQLHEICGENIDYLSNKLGFDFISEVAYSDYRYLLAAAVTRSILIQREAPAPSGFNRGHSAEDAIEIPTDRTANDVSGKSTSASPGSRKSDYKIKPTSLMVSVRNSKAFLQSLFFLNINRFVGNDVLIGILHTHRMLVPYVMFKMSSCPEYAWLLQQALTPQESETLCRIYRLLLHRMDLGVPCTNMDHRPLILIQCSGKVMYNNNFWPSNDTGPSWSDVVLSRHTIFYKDSFNRKFGFRPSDFLGAIIARLRGEYMKGSNPQVHYFNGLQCKHTNNQIQELDSHKTVGIMPFTFTKAQNDPSTAVNSAVWKIVLFILFDSRFFDRSYKERRNAIRSFLQGLQTPDKPVKRGKSIMLRAIFCHFKTFLQNITYFDISKEYWSCFRHASMSSAGTSSIDPRLIVRFVHNVVDATVPQHLLGCHSNFVRLKHLCHSIVVLNKGERLDMSQVMHGFKAVNCCWIPGSNNRITKGQTRTILGYISRIVFFLLEHMVIPLLQHHFYITETNFTMYRVHYFSKVKWHQMVMEANETYISEVDSMAPGDSTMDTSVARDSITCPFTRDVRRNSDPQHGTLRVRWIPKVSGMRPIMNCNSLGSRKTPYANLSSLNDMMHIPFHALRAYIHMNPRLLGNSILGYTGAFRSIKRWWSRFRKSIHLCNINKGHLTVYVTLADLSRCYERIQHVTLLRVLNKMEKNASMLFNMVYRRDLIRLASSSNSYSRRITVLSDGLAPLFIHQKTLLSRTFGQVCIYSRHSKTSVSHKASMSDIIASVRSLLSHKIALPKWNPSMLVQNGVGIPQGCCISPLLCSLYLAQGDFNPKVTDLTRPDTGNLLLRWIDDFIFISNNEADNQDMVRILRDPSTFGMAINDKLVTMRFDVPILQTNSKVHPRGNKSILDTWFSRICDAANLDRDLRGVPTGSSFPNGHTLSSWINCTFDFDFVRGRLNATLTPWKNHSCRIRDSLNLSRTRFSTFMFAFIEQRLLGYISNRLNHGLFTSMELNTPRCVMQNSYVVMRICMMKLLSATCAICRHFGGFTNARYIGRLAHKLIDHMVMLISRRADIRKTGLRRLLQLAVVYTISPFWVSRLKRKFGRRRIRFVRSIERKFRHNWPSDDVL